MTPALISLAGVLSSKKSVGLKAMVLASACSMAQSDDTVELPTALTVALKARCCLPETKLSCLNNHKASAVSFSEAVE